MNHDSWLINHSSSQADIVDLFSEAMDAPPLPIVPPRRPFAKPKALKEVKETSCTDAEAKNIARSTVAEAHQALAQDFVQTHWTVDDREKQRQHVGLLSVHVNIVGCCFCLCVCEWSGESVPNQKDLG